MIHNQLIYLIYQVFQKQHYQKSSSFISFLTDFFNLFFKLHIIYIHISFFIHETINDMFLNINWWQY